MGYLFILKDSSTVAFPYAKSQNKWPQICVLSENRLGWIVYLAFSSLSILTGILWLQPGLSSEAGSPYYALRINGTENAT